MIIGPTDDQDDDSPTDELPILAERDAIDLESSSILTLADDGGPVPAGAPSSTGRFPLPDGLPEVEPFSEPEADAASLQKRILLLEATVEDKDAEIASLAERLKATREAVARRDDTERQLRAQLAGGAPEMQQLVTRLEEAEWLAAQYAERVAELTSRLRTLEQAASRRDSAFAELEAELIVREALIVERERALGDGEAADGDGFHPAAHREAASAATLGASPGTAAGAVAAGPAIGEATSEPAIGEAASEAAIGEATSDAAAGQAASEAAAGAVFADAAAGEASRGAPEEGLEPPALAAALARSREEAAALASYIDCRRAHWLALEDQLEAHRQRLRELEQEIEQRGERERLAAERADAERRRADALKAELARVGTISEAYPASVGTAADAGAAPEHAGLRPAMAREAPTATLRARRPDAVAGAAFDAALLCLTSDPPRAHRLTDAPTLVGRGPHCDIRITTHFVSREHARVFREEHQVLIEDLGSKNGVFVNAVRVERDALRHGDLVTIGDTQFRFEIHAASLSA